MSLTCVMVMGSVREGQVSSHATSRWDRKVHATFESVLLLGNACLHPAKPSSSKAEGCVELGKDTDEAPWWSDMEVYYVRTE